MRKMTGRGFIDVPGWGRFDTKPGATLMPGGVVREPVESDVEVGNYTEKLVPAELSAVLNHSGDIDLVRLGEIVDAGITYTTDSGQTYLLQGGYMAEPPSLTGGEVSFVMRAKPARKVS